MIKSIEISNFQSHKHSLLYLDPGVNVIVGTSDSGKTAIIRALRWVKDNRPSGESMRSWWGGSTEVTVELEADTFLQRKKDKTEEYVVAHTGRKDISLKAFGLSVPMEISSTLNMTEVNLQSQLDAPFLLSSSAGDVAAHFNKIANLDKIDIGLQNVNKEIRDLTSTIKFLTTSEEKQAKELETYQYLQKFEIEIEVLEETENQVRSKERSCDKLEKLLADVNRCDLYIESYSDKLTMCSDIDSILETLELRKTTVSNQELLNSFLDQINSCDWSIAELEVKIPISADIDKILSLIATEKPLNDSIVSLKNLLNNIASVDRLIGIKESEFEALHEEFEKEMGEECILCGQLLKH